jgi:tRNA(fMet)-specific endonuclease VapC
VSEITIAEITYGALKSSNVNRELENVGKVKSSFTILPITDVLELYGQERLRLEKAGIRIPGFDLLIGTTSVVNNLILVTGNEKHLSRIKGVVIENWRKKENNRFLV